MHRVLGALCAALWVAGAQAEQIEITYTGTMTLVSEPLASTFPLGTSVSGVIRYDTATPLTGSTATRGNFNGAVSYFALTAGAYSAFASQGSASVQDDNSPGPGTPLLFDGILFSGGGPGTIANPVAGLAFGHLQFSLLSQALGTLSSPDVLPGVDELNALWASNVANFNTNFIAFQGLNAARYSLDSFSAVALIPEPQTYAMLLAGLGLLGFMARRRRRTK